jgi:hypothetical protein
VEKRAGSRSVRFRESIRVARPRRTFARIQKSFGSVESRQPLRRVALERQIPVLNRFGLEYGPVSLTHCNQFDETTPIAEQRAFARPGRKVEPWNRFHCG